MISITVKTNKPIPINEINKFADNVVFNTARITLDYTNSKRRFPYLSGELNRSSMAEGVKSLGNKSYGLGAGSADYAVYVWDMAQSTHWTNPNTYSQWYMKEFKNDKQLIMARAVSTAIKGGRL